MNPKKNILVFPCGSEIGLEIFRSLKHSTRFNLIGANSMDDHGKFVYEQYIGGLPFIREEKRCVKMLHQIVLDYKIDAIYPAMDIVIEVLKRNENELGCKVIAPKAETTDICLHKTKTYAKLDGIIRVPKIYKLGKIQYYPIFCKPDVGYSARGTKKVMNEDELNEHLKEQPNSIICEYLPGEEYTVDCFTNRKGELLFYGPRIRRRIVNGISVNTTPFEDINDEFGKIVNAINQTMEFRGAWFVQLKRAKDGELTLLEVAARLGGSSSLFRAKGVNFAQLTLFDAFDMDVTVCNNNYAVEMDRALDEVYKIDIHYSEVFVDFDDCLLLEKKFVNTELVAFLYKCLNENKKLTLLTHHNKDINDSLKAIRMDSLFDRIIHIDRTHPKYEYIDNLDSIFIDDSFAERMEIMKHVAIPVFGVDMIKCLIK